MQAYGQETPDAPTIPDAAILQTRIRFLLEEVLEAAAECGIFVATFGPDTLAPQTINDHLRVDPGKKIRFDKLLKELADVDVVLRGFFVALGVRMTPILEAVDANNLMKTSTGHLDATGKFVKSPNHPSALTMVAQALARQGLNIEP